MYINQTILYLHQVQIQYYNNSLLHTLTQQHITETSENLDIETQVPSSLDNLSCSLNLLFHSPIVL